MFPDSLARHHQVGTPIDKELLMCLGVVFGPETLEAALDLVDQRSVTQVRLGNSPTPSLYKVRGSSGVSYTILSPPLNRCPCPAWCLSTWGYGNSSKGKHRQKTHSRDKL